MRNENPVSVNPWMTCWSVILAFAVAASSAASGEKVSAAFDSAGTKIRYQTEGAGEPVFLVHGYTASGDMNWRLGGVVKELAKDHLVILIDNRGHGQSDKPEDPESYGEVMVQDALRLLDHLEIERADWVGYSMGGMITMKALTLAPERVRTAVISGMGWFKDDPENRARYRDGEGRGSAALRACYKGFGELGVTREQLLAIDRPVRLIVGSADGLYESSVKPLLDVRPDFSLQLIEGANHTNAPIHSDFARFIREALEQGSTASSGAGD